MKYVYILIFILFLSFLPITHSMEGWRRCEVNTNCYIGDYIYNDSYSPYINQICTIKITYPNNTLAIDSVQMQNNSDGYHNYTYIPPVEGYYRTEMYCVNGTDKARVEKSFVVVNTTTSTAVWTHNDRNLTWWNTSGISQDVWTYNDRNLTYYNTSSIDDIKSCLKESNCTSWWINTSLYQSILNVNTTIGNIRQSQISDFRLILSDFPDISTGSNYSALLTVLNYNGSPVNLSKLPNITIYDPNRNVSVDNDNMTYLSEGLYTYNFLTFSSYTAGVWETRITTNKSNVLVTINDYWKLSGSPADVIINRMVNTHITEIIANGDIKNAGSQGSDFQYVYCVVSNEENDCGGEDDIDYASATRYLNGDETWTSNFKLTVPLEGSYYFKIKARSLGTTEWATSSLRFDAYVLNAAEIHTIMCNMDDDCAYGKYCDIGICTRLSCGLFKNISYDGHHCEYTLLQEYPYIIYFLYFLVLFMIFLILYKTMNKNK